MLASPDLQRHYWLAELFGSIALSSRMPLGDIKVVGGDFRWEHDAAPFVHEIAPEVKHFPTQFCPSSKSCTDCSASARGFIAFLFREYCRSQSGIDARQPPPQLARGGELPTRPGRKKRAPHKDGCERAPAKFARLGDGRTLRR